MRFCLFWLVLAVVCLGCNNAEEARRKTAKDNLKQIDQALKNYHEPHLLPASKFTHVISTETEYYTTGPQQGRPPGGKFSAGIKINVIREAGSYTLVRSENGVEVFVASDALT